MAEKDKLEIEKVRIADVQVSASDELAEAEQEKVNGGGANYNPGPYSDGV